MVSKGGILVIEIWTNEGWIEFAGASAIEVGSGEYRVTVRTPVPQDVRTYDGRRLRINGRGSRQVVGSRSDGHVGTDGSWGLVVLAVLVE